VIQQGIDSVLTQRNAAVEAGEKSCYAILQIGQRDARVKLAEEREAQGHVIAGADVAETGDEEFEQEGFGAIAEIWLERADGGCLGAHAGFQGSAIFREERSCTEHGAADGARGDFPIGRSEGVAIGFAAGLVGGVTDEP
jgi:hypothetical protein